MAPTVPVDLNPSLLVWARETAGLDHEEAAKKLGISLGKLLACERGDDTLSLAQLRKAASVYKRSLGVFFLPEPPYTPPLLPDFRGLRDHNQSNYSSSLRFEIRHARYRRKLALELCDELGFSPEPFEITAKLSEKPEDVGRRIREWLGITFEQQKSWASTYESLNSWLLCLESRFVLVFQTKEVERDEMLGACVHYDILPVIILNGKYHPNSRVFTLMHELAHLAVGESGVSSENSIDSPNTEGDIPFLEQFCNHVAGEILLPTRELNRLIESEGYNQIGDSELNQISKAFGVSREVALRRLRHSERISYSAFNDILARIRQEYIKYKPGDKKPNGGPPYHKMVVRDNGLLFTRLVCEAFESSKISPNAFSSYLDVNLKHADKIINDISGRAS